MERIKGRVLVADDSITVRKVIEKLLTERGCEVSCAASGTEAIAKIEHERPDLVITDVVMPDKSGYEICEFVRSHAALATTPVLLISGAITAGVRERAVSVRATDVIGKPFSPEEVGRTVDALLARRSVTVTPVEAAKPTLAVPPPPAPPPPLRYRHPEGPTGASLKAWAEQLGAMPGVRLVIVVDKAGFLLEVVGKADAEVDEALPAALAACLAESAQVISRSLQQGKLDGVILESAGGVMLARYVGDAAIVAVLLHDSAYLGKVRYIVRRGVGDLAGG